MKSYYLAHPFEMRKEVRDWELGFEERTGINLLNPFYDVEGRTDIIKMDQGIIKPRTMKSKRDGMIIVTRDLRYIEKQDGIICFIEKNKESFGTPMELFYNSYILGRESYVISNTSAGHPWIRGLSTKIFKTKEELENDI